jgi:transposase
MNKKRKTYTPEEKAKIVLEVLREENTLNELSQKYSVSPQLISRWKTEFLENMPAVFDKKSTEIENMKKEHAAEKEELINQIGQLTVDMNWLKKKQQQALELKKRKS